MSLKVSCSVNLEKLLLGFFFSGLSDTLSYMSMLQDNIFSITSISYRKKINQKTGN